MMDKQLGLIFRLHREDKKIKSMMISEVTDISSSRISEFENGKCIFSEEKIRELYKVLEIEYQNPDNAQELTETIVDRMFHSILYVKYEETEIYEELFAIKNKIQCTSAYTTWILGYFLYHVYNSSKTEIKKCKRAMEVLTKNKEMLNKRNQMILEDTIGIYHKIIFQHEEALKHFDICIRHGEFKDVKAMAYYHKSLILNIEGHFLQSMDYIKKAKGIFSDQLHLKRIVMCSESLGNLYCILCDHENAEKIDLAVLEALDITTFTHQNKMTVYSNLIRNYLLWGTKYDKAIEYGRIALEIDKTHAFINFYVSYAYFKNNDIENAKYYIYEAKKYSELQTRYCKAIINAFYTYLYPNKSFDLKERKFLTALKEAYQEHNLQMVLFVLNLLVDLCEISLENEHDTAETKESIENSLRKYQNEMIEVYKKRR